MRSSFFKLFATAFIIFGCSSLSLAQRSEGAHAGANIVYPIIVSNSSNLNFENLPVSPSAQNKSPKPRKKKSLSKNIFTACTPFFITDEPTYVYSISLPSDPVVITNDKNTLTVTSFRSCPSSYSKTLGEQELFIEAILRIGLKDVSSSAAEPGSFNVTINYN